MNKYYKLNIVKTGKDINNKKDNVYTMFDDENLEFETLEDVKNELKERYGNCKRIYCYMDDKEGNPKKIGYIYCFKNKDISHDSKWWYEQDWVNININTSEDILLNGKEVFKC